jgi:dephospho-CoA kinase
VIVVGLTGGIGSGKSTVSAMLAERGAVVIDADRIAREVVEPGRPAYDKVVERFGDGVVADDGALDRTALAALVFGDVDALADLNAIVHPAVGEVMAQRMADESTSDHVVILDVPLLVESGRKGMAGVVVVDCPEDVAIKRLVEFRGFNEEDARRRVAAQASRDERRAVADVVIDNAGTIDELVPQVDAAWRWMASLEPHDEHATMGE